MIIFVSVWVTRHLRRILFNLPSLRVQLGTCFWLYLTERYHYDILVIEKIPDEYLLGLKSTPEKRANSALTLGVIYL